MNTRFCPHCGAKHVYDITKPKICAKCNKNMDTAFAAVPVQKPAQSSVASSHYRPEPQPRPQRRFYDSLGNDITHRFTKPEPESPRYSRGDEDYVDEREKDLLAQELAASINGQDFGIRIDDERNVNTVKLGSILKDAIQSAQQPIKAKATRRKKA